MKKKIFLIFLMTFLFACPVWGEKLSGLGLLGLPSPEIEDDVYGSGWNADGTHGPSQNAVYDILHQYDTDDDGDIDNIDSGAIAIGDLPTGIPDDSADTTHVALCSSTFNEFALHSGTSNVVSGATNSALAWVPATTNNLLAVLTGIESDPVILVISETGASHGDRKLIYNAGTIEIQIGTIDAQQEIVSGNTIYLPQFGIAQIIYVTDRWVASGHESNKISVKSIETPTLEDGELDDTSSPHTIVVAELKNVFLTNAGVGSGTTIEFDMPVAAEGWSFGIVVMDTGGGIIIDPNGVEQWWLNGVEQEAGENIEIEETVAGKSESIWCISCTESGVTTNVFCESKYSDWEGEND